MPHLFEFMDQAWLPSSLRGVLREILECGNSEPFRPYYRWVADEVLKVAAAGGFRNVVELGAGTGPITRLLAGDPKSQDLQLIVCDDNPDGAAYKALEAAHPGKVSARYTPVDFSQPCRWERHTLLLLSATPHHIPPQARPDVLAALTGSAERILVFEPLGKTVLSLFFVFPALVPALLLPLWFFRRPGKLPRFLWCWLLPVAPLLFWWDGLVSCLRQWTEAEWRSQLQKMAEAGRSPTISHSTFCQMIAW